MWPYYFNFAILLLTINFHKHIIIVQKQTPANSSRTRPRGSQSEDKKPKLTKVSTKTDSVNGQTWSKTFESIATAQKDVKLLSGYNDFMAVFVILV